MRLFKTKDLFLPECCPTEIKKDTLHYFIYGKGYQKTKRFEITDITLPDKWSKLSWYDIAILYDKYGIEVANVYAENKTAGIVSRQTAKGYGLLYQAIKDIIPENFNTDFFNCLACDYILSCFGIFILDIVATDNKLASIDNDYNAINCSYITQAGELINKVSMKKYVLKKYGQPYVDIIDRLCSKPESRE